MHSCAAVVRSGWHQPFGPTAQTSVSPAVALRLRTAPVAAGPVVSWLLLLAGVERAAAVQLPDALAGPGAAAAAAGVSAGSLTHSAGRPSL